MSTTQPGYLLARAPVRATRASGTFAPISTDRLPENFNVTDPQTADRALQPHWRTDSETAILGRMGVRTCRVSCWDAQGVEHMVQVTAQSLYEAVAQALRVFREDDWGEDPNRVPASVVVTINQPQVEHRVRIKDFENWLESPGKSPAEMALKSRLRDIIRR